jgi:hypothetical protein
VLDLAVDGVAAVHVFLEPQLFGMFGLPARR